MTKSDSRSRPLYEKILEAVPGGIVHVAHDGSLLLANPPAQEFLGLRLEADSHRYVSDFATDTFNEDGTPCAVEDYPVARCLATGEPQGPQTIGVRHPSGEIRWAVFTALPFDPGDGSPRGAVVSFVDITDRKHVEEQVRLLQAELAQRDRLASVGTLAAAVAHEINNPLAFIFLGLENARIAFERENVNAALIAELDDLQTGAARIRDIVKDLMAFSRIRDDQRPMDVNDAIRTAVRLAAPELRHHAQVVLDLRADAKVAGAGRLAQVVLNLVLNAGRSFEGSHRDARIDVTSQEIDGQIVVDVVDNGPGIDPDDADRIFDPFFVTSADGTGLGLAISRSLVADMGGTLSLVERATRGACFRITLPPLGKETPTLDDMLDDGVVDLSGESILLIDDEEVIRRLCRDALTPTYRVTLADSVAAAFDALERGDFDVVICDTMLLDGSGVDVYEWVAEHRPALVRRFMFITGGTFTTRVEQFFRAHDVPTLHKPFTRAELDARIDALLEPPIRGNDHPVATR